MKQEKLEPGAQCSDEDTDDQQSVCDDGSFIVVDFGTCEADAGTGAAAADQEGLQLRLEAENPVNPTALAGRESENEANECQICGELLDSPHSLLRHRKGHSRQRRFRCDQCDKTYTTRFNLTRHSMMHCGPRRPFVCDVCESGFSERGHLLVHKRIHTGEKPFECSYCHWAFAHKPHMIEHERIHTGERPFKCDHCGRAFRRQTHRRNHEKHVHKIGI